jgi:hypothetical protein
VCSQNPILSKITVCSGDSRRKPKSSVGRRHRTVASFVRPIGEIELVVLRHELAILRQRFPSAFSPVIRLEKIVSGGQTGADQAALDVARERGLKVGGWVPKGRLAEDGLIPERYSGLVEAHSDATLIVSHGPLTGGSLLTLEEASRWRKPVLHLDLHETTLVTALAKLRLWLDAVDPHILNVAGPRASKDAAIFGAVVALLRSALP